MLPLDRDQGIGVIPWKPQLAAGRLARDWGTISRRSEHDESVPRFQGTKTGRSSMLLVPSPMPSKCRAQIALTWLPAQPGVTAPIVGATRTGHLKDAIAAVGVQLTSDDTQRLEGKYRPIRPCESTEPEHLGGRGAGG